MVNTPQSIDISSKNVGTMEKNSHKINRCLLIVSGGLKKNGLGVTYKGMLLKSNIV